MQGRQGPAGRAWQKRGGLGKCTDGQGRGPVWRVLESQAFLTPGRVPGFSGLARQSLAAIVYCALAQGGAGQSPGINPEAPFTPQSQVRDKFA